MPCSAWSPDLPAVSFVYMYGNDLGCEWSSSCVFCGYRIHSLAVTPCSKERRRSGGFVASFPYASSDVNISLTKCCPVCGSCSDLKSVVSFFWISCDSSVVTMPFGYFSL